MRPPLEIISPKSYRKLELASDRSAANTRRIEVEDQDVVALELEGGFKLWMNGKRLRAEMGRPPSRGGEDWELRTGLPIEDAERGVGEWVLTGLEVFGLDPVALAVNSVAERVEGNNGNLILRYNPAVESGWTPLEGTIPDSTEPLLLFIHGTFSSSAGSFGNLFADQRRVLDLRRRYDERIYGFEHRTLTEHPIDNLLDLAPQLSDGVRLHLASHSRGGLVGDLLALSARPGTAPPFTPDDLDQFDDAEPVQVEQSAKLERLGLMIRRKGIGIERFARVASPSRGTTLGSVRPSERREDAAIVGRLRERLR